MAPLENEKLDVIIFGASGFTGKWTVFEACRVLEGLTWGVAGRSRSKLQAVLEEMSVKANKNLSNTPIIIADVEDYASCEEMARRCRIVVNCSGPYRMFGEPVVRACLEAGTHHVDVSGESYFMESMQLKYHKQAQERGVYIISACGFDSIPTEMGIAFLEQKFDGVLNSAETFLKSWSDSPKRIPGPKVNYGTWHSLVNHLSEQAELMKLRSELFSKKLPKFEPKLESRGLIAHSEVTNQICVPFPSPDLAVASRTQRYLYETEQKRPIQVKAYLNVGNRFAAILMILYGALFVLMSKFKFGIQLLLDHPKLFSFGMFSREGPSEEQMKHSCFAMYIKGQGWPSSERLAESTDQYKSPPSKSVVIKVSGRNAGYGATCVSLLCSALTVLKESDKMPGKGGVLTPGAAFAKTNMISELEKHELGLKFELVK